MEPSVRNPSVKKPRICKPPTYRVRLRGLPRTISSETLFEKLIACFKRHERNLYDSPDLILCDVSRYASGSIDLLVESSSKQLLLQRIGHLKIPFDSMRCRPFGADNWKRHYGFGAWLVAHYGLDGSDPGRRRVRVGQRRPIGNNTTYHVWNRTAHRRLLFGEVEKDMMLQIVERQCTKMHVQLHSYSVLDNHYHLIVTTQNDVSISDLMQQIDWQIATAYNRLHNTTGALWQGPFKHAVVEPTAANLIRLIDYVHANALRAGIVVDAAQYRWSSYGHYAGSNRRKALVVPLSMRRRWPQRKTREACYVEHFAEQYRSSKLQYDPEMSRTAVIGSRRFVQAILAGLSGPGRLPAFLRQALKHKRQGAVWGLKTFLHLLCQPLIESWMVAQNCWKELVDRIGPLVPVREAPV
jgi:REP-associated tyrosine transposase